MAATGYFYLFFLWSHVPGPWEWPMLDVKLRESLGKKKAKRDEKACCFFQGKSERKTGKPAENQTKPILAAVYGHTCSCAVVSRKKTIAIFYTIIHVTIFILLSFPSFARYFIN